MPASSPERVARPGAARRARLRTAVEEWTCDQDVAARLVDRMESQLDSRSWCWTAPLRRMVELATGRPAPRTPVIASGRDAFDLLDGIERSLAWEVAAPIRVAERFAAMIAGDVPGRPAPEKRPARQVAKVVHGSVLSADPIVIFLLRHREALAGVAALAAHLDSRPAAFLVHTPGPWLPDQAIPARQAYDAHVARYPAHEITFLCNDPTELELLTGVGLPARLLNKNMLVDEHLWTIAPDVEKRFDAVYNAQMLPLKRHWLAREVKSLALVYYLNSDEAHECLARTCTTLAHAEFCNGPPGRFRWMPAREVARVLNASRTGLCLSRLEGNMRASIEYLMCGLPVVTTPAVGGRDRYFDPEFCETVPANPAEVAEAVRRLVARRIDPHYIRARSLARVRQDRESFLDLVQDIFDRRDARRQFRDEWPALHRNYLVKWKQQPEALLRDAGIVP